MMGVISPLQLVGRYAIYDKIASGGMASVHFGRLLGGAGFSRTVAIKRLHPHLAEDPDFLSEMIDEARLAARIHHPNVVPTLDVVATNGELLLVMEYVRGESLSRLLRLQAERGQRVPLPIVSAIVLGALRGLHAAHEATSDQGAPLGIVHRDVSPQNILVGVDGMPRVIDFGIAKAAGRLQTTEEGTVKGKIAYMAPEQLLGEPVTRTADVYGMGVVLWEMLAGTRLFGADTKVTLIGQVLAGVKAPPSCHAPNLPPELDALVMRALSRDSTGRFATAREMVDMLTRVLPPALADDVGDWCAQTAHDALARRGTLLAEIESTSGVLPMLPQGAAVPVTAVAGSPPGAPPAGTVDRAAAPPAGGKSGDEVSTLVSQAPGLSLETPTPGGASRWNTSRAVLMGTLVVGVLTTVGLAVAVGGGHKGPEVSDRPIASAPLAQVPASSSLPQVATSASGPAAPPVLPASKSPPSVATELSPVPLPVASPRHPPAPAAPLKPKPPTSCDPNFYYDENGETHFKPECFTH